MPKKTKKEKIIAQLRRKLETVSLDQKPEVESEKWEMGSQKMEISLRNISFPNPTSHIQLPASLTYSQKSFAYIMNDLRKTFFLTGLAISLEFIIYWLIELGGNRFFKFLSMLK